MSPGGARPLRPFGALTVLAGAFALSAALRTGEVVAALPGDGFANPLAESEGQRPAPERETATELVAQLQARREAVAEREAALQERAQTLEAMEDRLRARLDELSAAQEELEATAALVEDAAGRDIRHLAAMYQGMKPKEAGVIFNQMAPSFAAGFLAEMEPDKAALIMANMEAEKAYAVSLLLAGRNVPEGPGGTPAGLQPSLKPAP